MLKLAKVTTVDTNTIKITYVGENVESQINYYRLASYTPTINNLVLVDEKLKVILGEVVK